MTKRCSRCKAEKPTASFSIDKSTASGLQNYCKVCSAEYQKQNKAKRHQYRAKRAEDAAAYQRKYRNTLEGRATRKAAKLRRKARLLNQNCGCVTGTKLQEIWSLTQGMCSYCGKPAEHYEHIDALARGGLHCISNITPACSECNYRKKAMPVEEFLALHGGSVPTRLLTC